ncbi:MAG TPA: AI-2E family transporter [Gemmatimonadales bacterium]|nr:AI-2E family transporter [Gemmatimonadales bacterium]
MTLPTSRMPTSLLVGIFLILLTAALKFGAGLLLPIAIAGLFTLLLDPAVRALRRLGVPTAVGAGLLVFGTVGVMATGGVLLAGPAANWIEDAPTMMTQAQRKVRRLLRPIQETAKTMEKVTETAQVGATPTVQIQAPGLLERLRVSTTSFLVTAVTVVFLTYFQLATLPVFRKKLADLIGTRDGENHTEEVLSELEGQMSRYMLLNTLTSAGVGLATWALLAAIGLPNAVLWGTAAFLLNFIPYAGAVVTVALIGVASLVSFNDTGPVVLAMAGSIAINLVEGNLVTPYLMGRHLPLNPVAIFVSLLYWGWVWGPVGALLAVPLTVMLQVICSRVAALKPVAVLLDS